MAGSFKYVLIGGVVFGVMAGTIAALTVGGGSNQKAPEVDKKAVEPPKVTDGAAQVETATEKAAVEKAERANEAGKEKLYGGDWRGASELFREAIARVPDPKYFINLGTSLFQ